MSKLIYKNKTVSAFSAIKPKINSKFAPKYSKYIGYINYTSFGDIDIHCTSKHIYQVWRTGTYKEDLRYMLNRNSEDEYRLAFQALYNYNPSLSYPGKLVGFS